MPIDPSIALSVKPPQFQNPLEMYLQQAQLREAENRNALAQYQMARQREEDSRMSQVDQAWQNSGGDRTKYLSAIPGRMVPDAMKKFGEADEKTAKIEKEKIETALKTIEYHKNALTAVNDQGAYNAWRQSIISSSPQMAQMVPAQFSPEAKQQLLMTAQQMAERLNAKLHFADNGQSITGRNPYTNEQVGAAIPKTMTPGEVSARAQSAASLAETSRHNKASEVNAASGLSNQTTTNEGKLRDDYNQASKTFVTVRDAHQRVLASADQPSAAGDLALIFNYMKVLDPGSTVREGEFATAQNAGGIDDRTRALWNRVINGERLSDNIRNDFVNRSQKLYGAAESNQMETEKQYEGIATRGKMNPENVIVKSRTKEQPKADKVSSLPDPAKDVGGRFRDDKSGVIYKSDGKRWVRE